ncbi:DUF2478 domain-containing protein [Cognatishimia sp. MH4019]|uniref:DUF2478 domain-containing protein n=1 Tax=Cognatishimia sp. MH4019 TaxID=2854030 RepID=UPI001CD585A8|nr:DUF2478 domain-containing protein [Cognatishimia sp. MH4019]
MAPGKGDVNFLLFKLAKRFAAQGIQCRGTVQINTDRTEGPCDMDVQVLPDGPVLRISQNLGRDAKGCRLDPSVLETAVGHVAASLDDAADVLIINKFGKHEADGRGFRDVIARAIEREIPILIGINAMNRDAFMEFVGGLAMQVPPDLDALSDWFKNGLSQTGELCGCP